MHHRNAFAAVIAASCLLGALPVAAQQALNCSQFGTLGSNAPGAGQSLTFTNASESRRTIMWMDQAGYATYMTDLSVGESAEYAVAPGDIFSMVDGPGNCVEMFRVTTGQTKFKISVVATGAGGD